MFSNMALANSMLIKVNYEGKIRRLRVRLIGDELNHTIQQLKEKIVSLFGLTVCADRLILTCVDQDGDVVGLADSYDLRDVVQQALNSITVTVTVDSTPSQKTASNKSLRERVAAAWNDFIELLDHYKRLWFPLREPEAKAQPNKCKTSDYVTCGVSNLESCLIGDVNEFNEPMAPSTPFTKIWRMRNNGTAEWPQKTELIWLGGDKLSHQSSFELELPEGGLPVDEEINIGVNLVCPSIPGEYIALWRLASPTGEKFGQRIKIIIEVEDSEENLKV